MTVTSVEIHAKDALLIKSSKLDKQIRPKRHKNKGKTEQNISSTWG
jgi:hypothetical protein